MHRLAVITAVLLLLSVPAVAQQSRDNSLSVFVSDPSFSASGHQTNLEGGFGVAISRMFSDRFSVELSAASESHRTVRSVLTDGVVSFQSLRVWTHPVDVTARYHFLTDGRWKPYVGTGMRYVTVRNSYSNGRESDLRMIEGELSGGVVFQVRPELGIFFDAKQVLGSGSNRADPAFKPSLGLSWRF